MDCLHPSIFLHPTFRMVATPFFIAACVTAALGNTFCLIVLRQPSQRTKSNKILTSLALSDCLVGYISFPMAIWLLQNASRSPDLLANQCLVEKVYLCFTYWTFGSSSISIIFIAYDRFLLITKPSQHNKKLPDRKIFYIILAYWVLAFIFAVVWWINIYLFVFSGLLLQVTPILLLCTSYYYIWKAVRASRKRVSTHVIKTKTQNQSSTSQIIADSNKPTKSRPYSEEKNSKTSLKREENDKNQNLNKDEPIDSKKLFPIEKQSKNIVNTGHAVKSAIITTQHEYGDKTTGIKVLVKSDTFPKNKLKRRVATRSIRCTVGIAQVEEAVEGKGEDEKKVEINTIQKVDNVKTGAGEPPKIQQNNQSTPDTIQTRQTDKRAAMDKIRKKARTQNRETKLAKKVTTLILFYLIAVLPAILVYILTFAAFIMKLPSPGFSATPYVISFGVFCTLSNSAINPGIYIQNDPEFRRACKTVLRRMREAIQS